jgi:hypothetical protein
LLARLLESFVARANGHACYRPVKEQNEQDSVTDEDEPGVLGWSGV